MVSPSRSDLSFGCGWGFFAILVLAVILRAPRLIESLWYDEIASYIWYAREGPWYIISTYNDPSNHIFHTLLVWASVEGFGWLGSLEAAFRLPALVASLLSIGVMFALGRDLAGARAGAMCAVLAAILPVMVLEGAEARGYSAMIFFSAAATLALLKGLRAGGATAWILYAVCCALGIWSHLMTVFVPAGHAAVLLLMLAAQRENRRRALAGLVAIASAGALSLALYSPALADVWQFYAAGAAFRAQAAEQPTLLSQEGLHALLQFGGSWWWPAALPGMTLFAAGAALAMRNPSTRLALGGALAGIVVMLVTITIAGSWMYARFALFVMPGVILAMTIALECLWKRSRALGAAAFAIIALVSAADLFTRPPKQPLRDAVDFAMEEATSQQEILAVGLNVGAIRIYAPDLLFTTHAAGDLGQLSDEQAIRQVIVYYPHLLTREQEQALRDAEFALARTFAGWADWGRGNVQVWQRQ